ncbi:serine/threonine-protein kinase [Microcoleus sp. FACHB-672]|uniref:serine/threonine-protein kinase n=1 Tax=Microcoleus sp. FACHB-672 TaxID=2692825 RepID=UPI001687504D|nr:serine/threonine-protein kinase [Microcoleus sp. FACHB-672]MBD2041568.1 tetratricopeptide repeat protein [Microcoleus sp. FACHB-672]
MIGQLLDRRYRLVKLLGSNTFRQTYLAADTHRPGYPQCVVKQLRPPNNHSRTFNIIQLLFKKKAEILEKLGKHDQIPQLLAFFEENKDFYIVEEFIAGQSLAEEIVAGVPLSEDQVFRLLQEVLGILVFVHHFGVIHREIHPENIIRRQLDGRLVLINFEAIQESTSKPSNSQIGQFAAPLGDSAYKSIEQLQGNPVYNSDIYALGIISIQALTGLPAEDLTKLQNSDASHVGELLWRHRTQVSQELADILDKMIVSDFRDRYQTALDVLTDLNNIGNNSGDNQPLQMLVTLEQNDSKRQPRFREPAFRQKLLLIGAGLAALIAIAGLGLEFHRQAQQKASNLKISELENSTDSDHLGAIQSYNQAILLNPNNAEVYYKRGNSNYDLGNLEDAKADYTQAIRLDSKHAKAYQNRGLVYSDLTDYRAAIDDYNQAIVLQPDDAAAYEKRGRAYFNLNDYKAAIEDYTQVIRLNNQDAFAYINRGLARSAAGDKQGALADYTQAIRIDPNSGDAFYSRGRVRFYLADYQGAMEDYTDAIRVNPKFADAYINRCSALLNLGQYQKAAADCTQALKFTPNDAIAYGNRCIAYFNLRDYQKAIEDCTQAIGLDSNNSKAYSNRGLARAAAKDKPGAIDDFTKAIRTDPSDAVAYSNRAEVHSDLGNYSSAIEDYTQAIRLKQDHNGAYYGRGLIRARMGDKQGAIEDFQKSAKLCIDQGNTGCYNDAQYQIKKLQS